MEDIKVKISKETRRITYISKKKIGNDGENLQGNLVFSFDDEFVDGQARIETVINGAKAYQVLTKEQETYKIPIKSVITKYGVLKLQVVITEGTNVEEIPIFKSDTFEVMVDESINAQIVQPDEYPTWIELANEKLNEMDEALEDVDNAIDEVENLDLDISKSGKVATVTLTKKDASVKTITLSDGTSLMFQWSGTSLGIKTDEDEEYTYVDLQGIQGEQGPMGAPFTIKKTYSSVAEMNADFNNMNVGDYVMITSTVEVEDNAKLYCKGTEQWIFITDFSGATGIQGPTGATPNIQIGTVTSGETPSVTRTGTNENPVLNFTLVKGDKGDTGNTGATGATGNGIASINKTGTSGPLVDIYTITYTNGTTTTFQVTNGEDGDVTPTEFNALKQDVEDLRDNQIISDEVTGTSISVSNAAKARIYNLELNKESSQHTTTGKNLCPTKSFTSTSSARMVGTGSTIYGISATSGTTYIASFDVTTLPNVDYRVQFVLSSDNIQTQSGSDPTNRITTQVITCSSLQRYSISLTAPENGYLYIRCVPAGFVLNNIQVEQGTTATDYEEYTNGASPNPEYSQEVKTVKGIINVFNKENINWYLNANGTFIQNSGDSTNNRIRTDSFEIEGGKTYTISGYPSSVSLLQVRTFSEYGGIQTSDVIVNGNTFTLGENVKYIHLLFGGTNFTAETKTMMKNANICISEGTEAKPYVPYGSNYIIVNVSDGTNTNRVLLPLNGNEIAGIGNNLDELIVDKTGHVYLNKLIGKKVLDGTESWEYQSTYNRFRYNFGTTWNTDTSDYRHFIYSNYFHYLEVGVENGAGYTSGQYLYLYNYNITLLSDFKAWLSTHNTEVYYVRSTPQLIDLNTTVDIRLFKGSNTITNSETANMKIKYVESIDSLVQRIVVLEQANQ